MSDLVVQGTVVRSLAECEADVEDGMAGFVKVGQALAEIRDSKLYCNSHDTFDDYCRERFGMDRTYAFRQMQGAEVVGLLPMGNITERVVRELVPLRDEPQKLQEVWSETVEKFGDRPTAAQVREVRTNGKAPRPEKECCPTCGRALPADMQIRAPRRDKT